MMFLPECFDMVCENRKQVFENSETIDGPLITNYRNLASTLNVWLFLGGFHERNKLSKENKVSNAHIVINDKGEIVSIYRKLHLFNLDVPGTRLVESEFSIGGNKVEAPVDTPAGKVGLGICYDVRFPEFAISMAKAGASILTYPSSFTVKTGLAHWEPLLKARAIENQCYVIAAAQTGIHNLKRSSYGHAMIIDPWGHIIAQVGDKTGFAIGEIDLNYLKEIRNRLPVWKDRKPECYGFIIPAKEKNENLIDQQKEYKFGQKMVNSNQVFIKTNLSFAFVNHKPIVEGHVLVSSLKEAKKLTDLTQDEIADLFFTVQKVQILLEKEYKTNSCTVFIQDGKDADQIEQIHVHILPRKPNDSDDIKDKIYEELQKHNNKKRAIRSEEEIANQALKFRHLQA
ncbi:hypothetical protein RND71_043392 [Anisodus tanguticus]|uniref:Bis(5'-adenosyl)-triphosphatase n=1 Tax=Anisodus tanguticus TaxID=243964 RepID=A0AAE1UTX7_9SOLA|nr:hypothetical protein RND71_043392 [Anisodus tanguticus]